MGAPRIQVVVKSDANAVTSLRNYEITKNYAALVCDINIVINTSVDDKGIINHIGARALAVKMQFDTELNSTSETEIASIVARFDSLSQRGKYLQEKVFPLLEKHRATFPRQAEVLGKEEFDNTRAMFKVVKDKVEVLRGKLGPQFASKADPEPVQKRSWLCGF